MLITRTLEPIEVLYGQTFVALEAATIRLTTKAVQSSIRLDASQALMASLCFAHTASSELPHLSYHR